MFWLLTLPFRIVFGILLAVLSLVAVAVTVLLLPLAALFWLPVLVLRGGFRAVGGLLLAVLFGLGAVLVAAVALVPLVPIVLLLGALWLVGRLLRPRTVLG